MQNEELPAQLRVLLHTQFGPFAAANTLSLTGTWMQRIACSWLVWHWTGSAFWLGVLAAGDLLPVILVGPIAGVVADRWDRLKLNRIAQAISAFLAFGLSLLLIIDHLSLPILMTFVTLQGALIATVQPARLAMVQQLVHRKDVNVAVALNAVNVNLARLIGPAAAGMMIVYFDIFWIFAINAIVTLLFVIILGRLKLSSRNNPPIDLSFFTLMREGFGYVWNAPKTRLILGILLLGGFFVRSLLELAPAIAEQNFTDTSAGLAILTGSAAVGSVISGLTIVSKQSDQPIRNVIIWWAIAAISSITLVHSPTPIFAMISSAVMGGSITRGLICTQTFVQLTTPDALRGRVLSIQGMIARASPAFGALAIGFVADATNLQASIVLSSLLLIIAAIFIFIFER